MAINLMSLYANSTSLLLCQKEKLDSTTIIRTDAIVRVGVLKGDGCFCNKCRPDTTGLGRDVITIDSNAVLDPHIITNGIFASFDDAVKCCDRLNISKLLMGGKISSGNNMSRGQRIKCSGCNRQFMTFEEISSSTWRLYSHETLESYIAHDCEAKREKRKGFYDTTTTTMMPSIINTPLPENERRKRRDEEAISSVESNAMLIDEASPPPWVSLVFSTTPTSITVDDIELVEGPDGYSIAVLKSSTTSRRIRLEYKDKELRQAASAHFIFINLSEMGAGFPNTGILTQQFQENLQKTESASGQSELWIETCPSFEGIVALHFSSEKIEFYSSILRVAVALGLRPLPDYCMLGLSTCILLDHSTWNFDSWTSPHGIHVPQDYLEMNVPMDYEPIKVGVIEKGFYYHTNFQGAHYHPELNETRSAPWDRLHGTHVTGIIGASANHQAQMKGLCQPDHIELHLYTLISLNILIVPNTPRLPPMEVLGRLAGNPFFIGMLNCFQQCKDGKMSLVNVSMDWCGRFEKQYVENMVSGFEAVLQGWDDHFVFAAGNKNRNLDFYQINQTSGPEDLIYVDVFSALAVRLPQRVTIVSASDVFGHHCSFSNYGSMVAVAAPGKYILSTSGPDNANINIVHSDYELLSGTSQSAPLGTAAIADIKLISPNMSYTDIVDRIKNTADIDYTLLGKCIASGRLNMGRAFALSGNLASDVHWRAYPARSKSLVSYDEKISEIMDSMTVAQLLQWCEGHGTQVLNAISCAHLFKAIDPFRAIDDGERVNQGAVIVARIRDLAEQEQHPRIQQRLIDIASEFEQQVPQPLPALPVWLHGLADQLLQDNQALSEWRHPYPLPASQPALLNNLPGFLHLLADSLHVRTLREFFQLLANDFPPPVETLRA